jgi:hypothetical protein
MIGDTNKNPTDLQLALWGMHIVVVHDSRDWGASNRDARLWAMLVGWDDDAYKELSGKHGWTAETVRMLKQRHVAIEAAKGEFPEPMVQR